MNFREKIIAERPVKKKMSFLTNRLSRTAAIPCDDITLYGRDRDKFQPFALK